MTRATTDIPPHMLEGRPTSVVQAQADAGTLGEARPKRKATKRSTSKRSGRKRVTPKIAEPAKEDAS